MNKLKLTYFDIQGGRAEPARLALHIAGIEFEDFRFKFDTFKEIIATTPLQQVPTLAIDGIQITQCNAINRYVGKKAKLYPEDPFQALLCDEIMEALEDCTNKLVATFGMEGSELEKARAALASGPITKYLKWTEAKLDANGGEFFVGENMTMADLKVFVWVRGLNSGNLDHIPMDLVEKVAPKLNEHCQRIAHVPAIAEYYSPIE